MPSRWWLKSIVVAVATVRFLMAIVSAAAATHGDFYATLPGTYAETLNPTLWDAADLSESWAFHQRTYLHGPTQYLTLYPIVFLNSYRTIAAVLLAVYVGVIFVAVILLRRLCQMVSTEPVSLPLVYAVVVLFTPILQALGQREFEIVILAATVVVFWAVLTNRLGLVGTVSAYITAFKYMPVLIVPYLIGRRWWRAVVAYAAGLAVLLVAAHVLFGLPGFFNDNVTSTASDQISQLTPSSFCATWTTPVTHTFAVSNQTFAGIQWGLCRLQDRARWIPLPLTYFVICATIGVAAILMFRQLERFPVNTAAERWRRMVELSLVVTIYTTFFYNHYYYLVVLVVPLAALLIRFVDQKRTLDVVLWVVTYMLLGAFILPASVFAALFRTGLWTFYMGHALYLAGELALIALLLREYYGLAVRSDSGRNSGSEVTHSPSVSCRAHYRPHEL